MFPCSEEDLPRLAAELAQNIHPGDRIILEGPMGAGKTTLARHFLHALGVTQPAEGSPSFALIHAYHSRQGEVAHMDFYRIRSESEIDEAGIPAYFWEQPTIVITEWLSLWPEFEASIFQTSQKIILIKIDLTNNQRTYSIYVK